MARDKQNLSDCYDKIYNNVKHHAEIQYNSYFKSENAQCEIFSKHCIDSKTQHDDFTNIDIYKMEKFPAIGKAVKFELSTDVDNTFIFVLSHSTGEPNKHTIYYSKIKDGEQKSQ